jgi:FSR family fosmidomycin resistance protein-like MFS transporter
MATEAISVSSPVEETFQTGEVLSIAGGHLINDTYTAFLPTLLPLLIDKMSLSLVLAGSLTSIAQIPALLDPFIGYLADRLSLRYFVIFAPAVTATVYSSLGFAPSYLVLAVMLFVGGISTAAFHAPAPAMISRISGRQLGKGMSFFMAAGELGRTIGPLLFVWAVSTWTLDGYWRVMVGCLSGFIPETPQYRRPACPQQQFEEYAASHAPAGTPPFDGRFLEGLCGDLSRDFPADLPDPAGCAVLGDRRGVGVGPGSGCGGSAG